MFIDAEQVGQAFDNLTDLTDDDLTELLPSHGFPADSVHRLRTGDRVGLIGARLETLIAGEREFMQERNITLPSARTAASIADSEVSDED